MYIGKIPRNILIMLAIKLQITVLYSCAHVGNGKEHFFSNIERNIFTQIREDLHSFYCWRKKGNAPCTAYSIDQRQKVFFTQHRASENGHKK